MKHCSLELLGLGLLGGSILSVMPTTGKDAFENRLTESQMAIWSDIRKERFYIYLFSLSVALMVARTIHDTLYRTIVALSLTASLYMIVPKSKYMVDHLRSDQTKELRELYQNQIWKYHGTIVMTLLGIPLICK